MSGRFFELDPHGFPSVEEPMKLYPRTLVKSVVVHRAPSVGWRACGRHPTAF